MTPSSSLVLASASATRARLLESAGLAFSRDPADLDEAAIKIVEQAKGSHPTATARALAEAKAARVSARHPGMLVIGADQILDSQGAWFDKAGNRDQAAATLRALRGRTHRLVSAAAVVRDGRRLWRCVAHARLTMRSFSDGFLDRYLDAIGDEALQTVGVYRLEGLGVQLFSRVTGDYFTILGLPLLPLLDFLRRIGVVDE